MYVKCGHCPACLQEKAQHRVSRIKNNDDSEHDTLMVTLTYERKFVPYVLRKEAYDFVHGLRSSLDVYRDCTVRKVRFGFGYDLRYKVTDIKSILCTIHYCDYDPSLFDSNNPYRLTMKGNKDLKYQHGKIGIAYYPDFQHFVQRLRINLQRNFNYAYPIKTFMCSEYGTKSLRPHCHLLLQCRKGDSALLRAACIASWPFSNLQKFDRAVEKSYRGASYVASYVNCGSKFPRFLKTFFPPKHSYSKHYGLGNPLFQLPKILEMYERGTLSYSCLTNKFGISSVVDKLIPKYVIHRYFPKFKGYSRISPSSLVKNLQRISNFDLHEFQPVECLTISSIFVPEISYRIDGSVYLTGTELYRINIRLRNAYLKFLSDAPPSYNRLSFSDYFLLHKKIWNLYNSTILRLHMENENVPLKEKYDNLDEVKKKVDDDLLPMPVGFSDGDFYVTNPNDFMSVIVLTQMYEQGYFENQKHRSVNNAVLSSLYEEF